MELTIDRNATFGMGATEPPATSRPVDLVYLSRYTLGNRSLENEVLELYCKQSRLYLQRLDAASTDKAWHEAAHTIRGSALGIGAWKVASLAQAAERLSGDQLAGNRAKAVADLAIRIDETNSYIKGILADA